jgi:hypothetical protein
MLKHLTDYGLALYRVGGRVVEKTLVNGLDEDMFHDMFVCQLVRSPDLDGYRAPKNEALTPQDPQQVLKPEYEATDRSSDMFRDMFCLLVHDMFHDMFVLTWTGTGHQNFETQKFVYFGNLGPESGLMMIDTVCLFISPDLDGYRASLTLRDPEYCKVPKPK